jgi:hypothetical protein
MDTAIVVVVFEFFQFPLQVMRIPEKNKVQVFPANGPNEPLDKRRGDGHMRHGADGLDSQDVQIGLPTLKVEQAIMVQTEMDGKALTGNGVIEYSVKCDTFDGARLHPKANGSSRKLIHHNQDPMRFEEDRFHPEQVHAPKAVFGMTKQREPRRATHATIGPVMGCQNPPRNVLVDLSAKGFSQLLRNAWTTEMRIALLEFNNGSDQFRSWPPGAGLALVAPGIEPPVLVRFKGLVKSEQGRGFENHRATQNPARMQK